MADEMSMVEKVAALLEPDYFEPRIADGLKVILGEKAVADWRNKARRKAQRIILALREPTTAMIAAHAVVPDDTDFEQRAADNWRAMIDAALSEPAIPEGEEG